MKNVTIRKATAEMVLLVHLIMFRLGESFLDTIGRDASGETNFGIGGHVKITVPVNWSEMEYSEGITSYQGVAIWEPNTGELTDEFVSQFENENEASQFAEKVDLRIYRKKDGLVFEQVTAKKVARRRHILV